MQSSTPQPSRSYQTASASTSHRPARRKRPGGHAGRGGQRVEALARGLKILRCFQPGVSSLSNLEISQQTGLPKSTVSRLISTLLSLDCLHYDETSGRYSPGYGILSLGFGCLASLDVRELVRPQLQALAATTGAAVALGVFDGQSMTYLDAVHGSEDLFLRLAVGQRVSLETAMGKAYLMTQPKDQQQALWQANRSSAGDLSLLEAARSDYEASGCCYTIGEWHPSINAVAAPFYMPTGSGPYVMSCDGPDTLLSKKRLRTTVTKQLKEALSPFQVV